MIGSLWFYFWAPRCSRCLAFWAGAFGVSVCSELAY